MASARIADPFDYYPVFILLPWMFDIAGRGAGRRRNGRILPRRIRRSQL